MELTLNTEATTPFLGLGSCSSASIGVGCLSDPLRKRLLETLDLSDIIFEPGYDPSTPQAQAFGRDLEERAQALFREKPAAEWLAILEQMAQ